MRKTNLFRIAFYTSLLTLLYAIPAFSQQRWERTYGRGVNDGGRSVYQTSDGGYIIVGYTLSFGDSSQVYLIKTNFFGDTVWTKTYGYAGDEYGFSVQQTTGGGYIVAGTTSSFGAGGNDVFLLKTNAQGSRLWFLPYGGAGNEEGYAVQQTSDSGYVIAGTTNSFGAGGYDVYLIKTNASGGTLWTRTYGGAGDEYGFSVQQTSDGGYLIAGETYSFGDSNQVYFIKTNALGDTLWTRTYGGTCGEYGISARQTSDSGYIIAGYTESFGAGGSDVYLIKANASGDTLWTRTFGWKSDDYGRSVQQTSDGGYIIAGETHSFGPGGWDVYLIKTNAFGDTLWTRTFGGTSWDGGYSVQQTSDGGYIIAGFTYSFGAGASDVYLIKTDANGSSGVEMAGVRGQGLGIRLTAKPNPFTSFASVPGHEAERFSLYDVSGRKVGTYRGDRVGEGLTPGVYFLRSSDSKDKPLRIVKVR